MKKINCPKCGKELIRLEPYYEEGVYEYWCDNCNIDITIEDNKEIKNTMRTIEVLAKENIEEILNTPADFVDHTFDKALVKIYDGSDSWMILIGQNEDSDEYYLVIEDDEMSQDYYPEDDETLEELYNRLF